jgi:hypothetical protein
MFFGGGRVGRERVGRERERVGDGGMRRRVG